MSLTFSFNSIGQGKAWTLIVTHIPPVVVHSSPAPCPSIRPQEYKGFTGVLLEIKPYHITEQYMTVSVFIMDVFGTLRGSGDRLGNRSPRDCSLISGHQFVTKFSQSTRK